MDFMDGLENVLNRSETLNGAVANRSTHDTLLNLFANGAAMRNSNDAVYPLFKAAFMEDPIKAFKLLFYIRDVRGGQGEREVFRNILTNMACDGELFKKLTFPLVSLIPEFGRWDDLYALVDTPIDHYIWVIIDKQLDEDLRHEANGEYNKISLCAKWLKTERTHGQTNYLGVMTYKGLGWSPKRYRKTLSKLRATLKVVERDMSQKKWKDIDYSKVPSQAMFKHRQAFSRHDPAGFDRFMNQVEQGEVKINAGTMYPYQLVAKVLAGDEDRTLDAQWNALPSWIPEGAEPALVMADTSGSMTWGEKIRPIDVSVSLAMYIAERTEEGPFKNKFMTFSSQPTLQTVSGDTLYEKANRLEAADWNMNTNLSAAFNSILQVGLENSLTDEQMPKRLIVVSDMQFDAGTSRAPSLSQELKRRFEDNGYTFPVVVWWNVNAYAQTYPMTKTEKGIMVAGASPEILQAVVKGEFITPLDVMNSVLDRPRYDIIESALSL